MKNHAISFDSSFIDFKPAKPKSDINLGSVLAAYNYLSQVSPFNKWNLPDPKRISFKISTSEMVYGYYSPDPDVISISKKVNKNNSDVLMTLSHELVHYYCEINGLGGHEKHNKVFKKYAAQVCHAFGWKLKDF